MINAFQTHTPEDLNDQDIDDFNVLEHVGSRVENYSEEPLTVTVWNLKPFTIYDIGVYAVTSAGNGPELVASTKTLESRPGSPPINISYQNITSTSINITWDEPLTPNGIVIKYSVYISRGNIFRTDVFERYAVIERLEKYKDYEVCLL